MVLDLLPHEQHGVDILLPQQPYIGDGCEELASDVLHTLPSHNINSEPAQHNKGVEGPHVQRLLNSPPPTFQGG